MAGESRYEIHQNAYVKLILHSLKHRASAVNGVLLGRSSADGATVEIVDSVPLFHSQIGLLPPLEIALIMVSHFDTECSPVCSSSLTVLSFGILKSEIVML